MFNVGGAEFFVILLVALLVIGPTKLPQAARQVGQFMGEFRRIANGFQEELKSAMDEPVSMAPKASPDKPKSPGGPTDQVIDAASSEANTEADDGIEVIDDPAAPEDPTEPPDTSEG